MKKLALLVTPLLVGMVLLFSNATKKSEYVVGDQAEDFSLKNVDGKMVSLADYKMVAGYIVVFTCNHCPYAQLYEQRIMDLHKKYASKGFPLIAINPNSPAVVWEDSYEEMQKRAKTRKYGFPYLFDEEQSVYPRFGATRTPHVFLLDSARVVRYIGAIDDNAESQRDIKHHWVEDAIDAMMHGEQPTPDYTRAVGCTIKKKP
ncbi:MAG: thioredoxin family protein [Saprospiraceae bacterium]|nr:thioredoxin family protein [Saprospiraceae bacterium]